MKKSLCRTKDLRQKSRRTHETHWTNEVNQKKEEKWLFMSK